MGLPLKDPAKRVNAVKPVSEWVDLQPLDEPVLPAYPIDWYRQGVREFAVPKWMWDLWRTDPVTSQWSPGDLAAVLELGQNYARIKPELRFQIQTALGLNSNGRRRLRWRNAAEAESHAKADAHAAEVRRLRIVGANPPEEA
jgi:hypothetical protein